MSAISSTGKASVPALASNLDATVPTARVPTPAPSTLNPQPSTSSLGFTLIELIGVVAVIAILAAFAVPGVIRQMDEAARTKEVSDLTAISNAFVLQMVGTNGTKTIPTITGMAQAVANWTRLPVAKVSTNPRGYARICLLDTNGWFGTAAGTLPYTQATNGTASAPVNARLMVVSRLGGPNLPVGNGAPGTTAFNDIWSTVDRAKPGTWTTWTGKGDDLLIQRINLTPLFHRLILVNRDTVNTPTFTIDSRVTNGVPAGGAGWDRYYLDGSALSLCDPTGVPNSKTVLTRDESFIFDGNMWSDFFVDEGGNEMLANEFADLAEKFMARQWPASAHQGADQQGSIVATFNLMLAYTLWANQCPHFPFHGISQGKDVPEYQYMEQIGGTGSGLNAFGRIGEFTGVNGLLDQ